MRKLFTLTFFALSTSLAMAQWNPNTSVNLEVAGMEAGPQLAASTSDGKTWVAFYTPNSLNYIMKAQLLDVDGTKLLGPDGVVVNDNSAGSSVVVYTIYVDKEDNLIIGAQDQRNAGSSTAVVHKVNQKGENMWNGKLGIELGPGNTPYIAELSNGEIITTWQGTGKRLGMQKISAAGVKVGTSPIYKTYGTTALSRGQIAPLSDSGYVVIFQRATFGINTNLYAQRFNNNGDSVWAASVKLCTEGTALTRDYSLVQDGDTTYFGYYSSPSSRFNSWLQRINPDGSIPYGINGAPFSLYRGAGELNQMTTNIAMEPGSPYIWSVSSICNPGQSQYGVAVQKFNKADGKVMLDAYGKEIYPLTTDRFAQQGGLALSKGRPLFIVSSDQSYLVKYTLLDTNGEFFLSQKDDTVSGTIIQQPSSLNKFRFNFTQNVNGQSVALWVEDRGNGIRSYAQNIDLKVFDTSIAVTTKDNVPAEIAIKSGTLQLEAKVLPGSASQEVTWSLIEANGLAAISDQGLVTAFKDGKVWAKAVSDAAPSFTDSIEITITNQVEKVGINQEKDASLGLKLYPNPTDAALYLATERPHPALFISITDVTGRVLLQKETPANSLHTPMKVNMEQLSQGIYFLQVKGEGISISNKITKR